MSQHLESAVIHRERLCWLYFADLLTKQHTKVRNNRVRRPTENALIKPVKQIIQEECVQTANPFSEELYSRVLSYLTYNNDQSIHLDI
jgi:hypothetical protein